MTPEERADALYEKVGVNCDCWRNDTTHEEFIEIVLALLHAVENDAFERAAQLCDGHLHGTAALIRTLKRKEVP